MINIIKNNKNKILIFGIVMLLAFLFTITMPKAYTINSNGNLVSENLININNYYIQEDNRNTQVNITNNNVIIITQNNNANGIYFDCILEENTEYTLYIETNRYIENIRLSNTTDSSESGLTEQIAYQMSTGSLTFTTIESCKYIRFWCEGGYTYTIKNIMLNRGATTKPYEPYGTWYSEENATNKSIFANMGLIQYLNYMQIQNNITHTNIVVDDIDEFTKEYLINNNLISSSGLLNLSYFNTSTLNPNYDPYKVILYFNDEITLNLFNLNFVNYSSGTINLIGNTNYNIQIDSNILSYDSNIIQNSNLQYIDEIVITFDSADALSNINFNSYSIVSYNKGYQYGYNTGKNEGYNIGLEEGETIGYNNGYAQGTENGATQGNTLYGMIIRSCRHTN